MVIAIMWLRNINLFWVESYMMSMGHGHNAEGRKYGVYFISKVHEAGPSDNSIPDERDQVIPKLCNRGESFGK